MIPDTEIINSQMLKASVEMAVSIVYRAFGMHAFCEFCGKPLRSK
jgi:hypothetical protein